MSIFFSIRKYQMFRTKNVYLYYVFIGHVHDLLLFLIYLLFGFWLELPMLGTLNYPTMFPKLWEVSMETHPSDPFPCSHTPILETWWNIALIWTNTGFVSTNCQSKLNDVYQWTAERSNFVRKICCQYRSLNVNSYVIESLRGKR